MLLPISELKGLNLTLQKRIALCSMFALGSLYVPPSLIHLPYKDIDITQCMCDQYGSPKIPQDVLPDH